MFSEMIAALRENTTIDPGPLRKRFDFALTKKMGILRLPPAFWMDDPKINPRADHLFWAALLLQDRERIDLAVAVISTELTVSGRGWSNDRQQAVASHAGKLARELLDSVADATARKKLANELMQINHAWFDRAPPHHDE